MQRQHATIVTGPAKEARHAEIAQHLVGGTADQQFRQTLPRVRDRVHFVKVILATVPGEFQFRTETVRGAGGLCLLTGLPHALEIAIEIHGPLIEIARGHREEERATAIIITAANTAASTAALVAAVEDAALVCSSFVLRRRRRRRHVDAVSIFRCYMMMMLFLLAVVVTALLGRLLGLLGVTMLRSLL